MSTIASVDHAGYLVALALQQSGSSAQEPHVAKALEWLVQHQDKATGQWPSTSLNKRRDATASGPGKFMSDAATGYAVLALTQASRASGSLVSRDHRDARGRTATQRDESRENLGVVQLATDGNDEPRGTSGRGRDGIIASPS